MMVRTEAPDRLGCCAAAGRVQQAPSSAIKCSQHTAARSVNQNQVAARWRT